MDFINYYDNLKKAYLNEFNAPELLPYETELVRMIESDIEERESDIDTKQDKGKESEYFISRMLLMALERTKYLLSSYLHMRLAKIEKFTVFLLNNTEARTCMSPQEEAYAMKFKSLVTEYYNKSVLSQFPESYANLEEPEMIVQPNLDSHVICRVDDSIGDVEIEPGGSSVHFEKGDVVAIRYKPIRGLVLAHRVSFC